MSGFSVVLLAAGSGSRMKSDVKKQYIKVGGKPLIYYPLLRFEESGADEIILVVSKGDEEFVRDEIVERFGFKKVSAIVPGGSERYLSVYEGLKAVRSDYVLVHDGARCCVTDEIISAAYVGAKKYKACVIAMPSVDTVKLSDEDGFVNVTPKRKNVWSIQTPQAFETKLLKDSYKILFSYEDGFADITDDAMIVERAFSDKRIKLVKGSYDNIKVTTPKDIAVAEGILC